MRKNGIFRYFLVENRKGYMIVQIEVDYELQEGDELNYRGNKLVVKGIEGDLVGVDKVGNALVVEPIGTKERLQLPDFNTSLDEIRTFLSDEAYDMEVDNEEFAQDLEKLANWLRVHKERYGTAKRR